MKEKHKQTLDKASDYILQFRDVRSVGLILFMVIALLVSWSGVKAIDNNYRLQKQISRLEQQTQVLTLENQNKNLENQYYETDQYLEVAARQHFGVAAPGETVLNIPRDVALAHTVDLPNVEQQEIRRASEKQPAYQRNFQAWMDFLLHRQPIGD